MPIETKMKNRKKTIKKERKGEEKEQKRILFLVKKQLYEWLSKDKNNYSPFIKEQVDNLTIEEIKREPLLDQKKNNKNFAAFIVFSSVEVLIPYDSLPNAEKEYNNALNWLIGRVIN